MKNPIENGASGSGAPSRVGNTFGGFTTISPQNPLILENNFELAQTASKSGRKDPTI
jgi:hypothetical protein